MALDVKKYGKAAWDFLFQPRYRLPVPPNIHAEAAVGARARALLDSEVYRDAVRSVREGIHIRWSVSPIKDIEGQHELRLMLKLLDDLEADMQESADTGAIASVQIAQEQSKQAKRKA